MRAMADRSISVDFARALIWRLYCISLEFVTHSVGLNGFYSVIDS